MIDKIVARIGKNRILPLLSLVVVGSVFFVVFLAPSGLSIVKTDPDSGIKFELAGLPDNNTYFHEYFSISIKIFDTGSDATGVKALKGDIIRLETGDIQHKLDVTFSQVHPVMGQHYYLSIYPDKHPIWEQAGDYKIYIEATDGENNVASMTFIYTYTIDPDEVGTGVTVTDDGHTIREDTTTGITITAYNLYSGKEVDIADKSLTVKLDVTDDSGIISISTGFRQIDPLLSQWSEGLWEVTFSPAVTSATYEKTINFIILGAEEGEGYNIWFDVTDSDGWKTRLSIRINFYETAETEGGDIEVGGAVPAFELVWGISIMIILALYKIRKDRLRNERN